MVRSEAIMNIGKHLLKLNRCFIFTWTLMHILPVAHLSLVEFLSDGFVMLTVPSVCHGAYGDQRWGFCF